MGLFQSEEEKEAIEKGKKLVDREIALYRRERELEVDVNIKDKEIESFKNLHVIRRKNVDAIAEAEHEYHQGKQDKEVKLARLDAEIKDKEALIAKADSIPELERRAAIAEAQAEGKEVAIAHLKEDVTRLDDLVKFLAGMLPKVELSKLGITLNADVKVSEAKK